MRMSAFRRMFAFRRRRWGHAGCSDSADHAIGHVQSDLPHDVEQIDAILKPYRAKFAEMAGEDEYREASLG